MTRISVVVPCFDQGRFLRDAVDSVLQSSFRGAQVVVVDDGSTDDTAAIAAGYGARITVVSQANRGLAAARNAGLAAATGELVHCLDADDRIDAHFLERMVHAAESDPAANVFCGGWRLCDAQNRPFASGRVDFPADAYPFLLRGNPMPCHAVVVRRGALAGLADGGAFDASLRALEDWDLWLRLARAGHRFVAVADATVDYRRYEGSMSRDIGRMLTAARVVLRKHRGRHLLARLRGMRTLRYGAYCENVLPQLRAAGWGAWARALLRHPVLIESALLHAVLAMCPPLRRRLRVSELPFAPRQTGRSGDVA